MGRPNPHAVLQKQMPQGFQGHAATPFVLFSTPWSKMVTFLAAAANRKDLRISTNSSLMSLPPTPCNCQLWSQFHAVTVWLPPVTQTQNHTYSYTEAHTYTSWESSAQPSLLHAAQHSRPWRLLCVLLTPQQQWTCCMRLMTAQSGEEGKGGETGREMSHPNLKFIPVLQQPKLSKTYK